MEDLEGGAVAWQKQAPADLTALPARQGFADLVQIVNEEPKAGNVPAWTAATSSMMVTSGSR